MTANTAQLTSSFILIDYLKISLIFNNFGTIMRCFAGLAIYNQLLEERHTRPHTVSNKTLAAKGEVGNIGERGSIGCCLLLSQFSLPPPPLGVGCCATGEIV